MLEEVLAVGTKVGTETPKGLASREESELVPKPGFERPRSGKHNTGASLQGNRSCCICAYRSKP
jgi:hypothetical protein